jgi:hypothetical protein
MTSITGPAEYRAPTWSWASVSGWPVTTVGEIQFESNPSSTTTRAEVVQMEVEPLAADDRFGQVRSGYLILRSKFYPIDNPLHHAASEMSRSQSAVTKSLRLLMPHLPELNQEILQKHRYCGDQHFALMPLIECIHEAPGIIIWMTKHMNYFTEGVYLLLESVAAPRTTYRRLGIITIFVPSVLEGPRPTLECTLGDKLRQAAVTEGEITIV